MSDFAWLMVTVSIGMICITALVTVVMVIAYLSDREERINGKGVREWR